MTERTVTITRADLDRAVAAAEVAPDRGAAVWELLVADASVAGAVSSSPAPGPGAGSRRLGMEGVLYYVGGLIVIGAMALFVGLAGDAFGAGAVFTTALVYLGLLGVAADRLYRRGLVTPGGLLATAAAVCVPVALYGLGGMLGLVEPDGAYSPRYDATHHVKALVLWASFLLASTVALSRYPFGFGVAPILLAACAVVVEVVTLAAGHELHDDAVAWLALTGGIAVVIGAFGVDRRTAHDHALWCYLVGASLAAWGIAVLLNPWEGSVPEGAAWVVASAVALIIGIVVQRRVFLVYGGLGLFSYVGYMAWEAFEDSLLLPFALTAVGLFVIGAGIWYQRRQAAIEAWLVSSLPDAVVASLPHNR